MKRKSSVRVVISSGSNPKYSIADPVLYQWVKHFVLGVEKTPVGFKYKLGLMFGGRTGIIKYGVPEHEIGPDWFLEGVPEEFNRSHFEQALIEEVVKEIE